MKKHKGNIIALAAIVVMAVGVTRLSQNTPGYSTETRSITTLEGEAASLFIQRGYIPTASLKAEKRFSESHVILDLMRGDQRYTGRVVCAPRQPCQIDSIM